MIDNQFFAYFLVNFDKVFSFVEVQCKSKHPLSIFTILIKKTSQGCLARFFLVKKYQIILYDFFVKR
jgi:hypothetical protein